MTKLKIAVYTMAKNESQNISQFCDTTAAADVVVVTDTGSTDKTPELLRERGVNVHEARIMPWRFDTASNVALAHVPEDIDICIKLDLDERLVASSPNTTWREDIERAWKNGTPQLKYEYVWSWMPGQTGKVPGVKFAASHIHARYGFVWQHPGHSALTYTGTNTVPSQFCKLQIHHYATTKTRPDYIPLLELSVKENECPRTLFYLGREYFGHKMYDHAIATLTKYLEHKKSYWNAERAEAMRILGMCFATQQQHPQATQWMIRATAEYRTAREPWYTLMEYMLQIKDWSGAIWAGTKALEITKRDLGYVSQDAGAWSSKLYIFLSVAYASNGQEQKCIETLDAGLEAHTSCNMIQEHALSTGLFEALA